MTQHITPAQLRSCDTNRPFTMIELLLVIAIILILASMLTPALGRTKYTAQLVACAANYSQLGVGILSGAANKDRKYPYRIHGDAGTLSSIEMKRGSDDDRPELREYLGDKINVLFNDPLTPRKFDYDQNTHIWVQPPVSMFWGWRYSFEVDGMFRLGDRWTFQGAEFNVLAMDFDLSKGVGPWGAIAGVFNAHPDRGPNATLREDNFLPDEGEAIPYPGGSRWSFFGSQQRGIVDTNVLFDDGSVKCFRNRGIDKTYGIFTQVPTFANDDRPNAHLYVPMMQ